MHDNVSVLSPHFVNAVFFRRNIKEHLKKMSSYK